MVYHGSHIVDGEEGTYLVVLTHKAYLPNPINEQQGVACSSMKEV
jgi:hypothetical protein